MPTACQSEIKKSLRKAQEKIKKKLPEGSWNA
jgi:hypothetical protein